jgi:ribulose-bisphosphate carboxylase large chain
MNITADDHYEMCARADFALETFGPDADKLAFLVDGYVGGPGMVTTARRQYPNQYLHYHRAGHGAVTSPSSKRGYTAFVLAKMSRLQGAPRHPRRHHGLRQDGRRRRRPQSSPT